MIFHRGRALYLYDTERDIWGSQRKPREHSGLLEDDSDGFGEFLGPEGSSIKEVQKLLKPWRCHRATLSQEHFEHYLPVMVTEFKLSEATSACAFVASHSIRR